MIASATIDNPLITPNPKYPLPIDCITCAPKPRTPIILAITTIANAIITVWFTPPRITLRAKDNSISLYSKSAEILSKCDQIVGNYNAIITQDQRMKNYALSIQNYLKSGRLKVASLKLEDFKNKFDRDLIYSDGSSFIKNTEAILDIANEKKGLDLEMTNSNRKIKSELKRIWHWSKK